MIDPQKIDPERLAWFERLMLGHGKHDDADEGACAMEAVAYIAGEPHSDHPTCTCPVLTSFVIAWNDALPDEDRNRLIKPRVPMLVGTRSTRAIEEARCFLMLDWYLREVTPKVFHLSPTLRPHAEKLRAMPPASDLTSTNAFADLVSAARRDADGLLDGLCAGLRDGLRVGLRVALLDGLRAGLCAGLRDGLRVGLRVGLLDGLLAQITDEDTWYSAYQKARAYVAQHTDEIAPAVKAIEPKLEELLQSAMQLLDRMIALR